MSRLTCKPGDSSDGAGKWCLAVSAEGSSCCTGGDGSPTQAVRHCQLWCRNPGGPVLAAGHVGQAGEKVPRTSGWPDTGRKRHRTATGAWEWSGESRHSLSFQLFGYHRLVRAPIDRKTLPRYLTLTCHHYVLPQLEHSMGDGAMARMFTNRVRPKAHRALLALGAEKSCPSGR